MQVVGAIAGVFALLGFLAAIIQTTWPWSAIPLVVILVLTVMLFAGRHRYRKQEWFRAEATWLIDGCDEGNRLWLESILKEADELHRKTEAAEKARRQQEVRARMREDARCTLKLSCRCAVHLEDMIEVARQKVSEREKKLRMIERQPSITRDFWGASRTPFDPGVLEEARKWVEDARCTLTDLKNEQRARREEDRILRDERLKAKMDSLEQKVARRVPRAAR